MQHHLSYQSSRKVATDPARKIAYAYILFVVILFVLLIGSSFFPGSWRDQFFVKSPPLLHSLNSSPFSLFLYIFFQATLFFPFFNLSVSTWFLLWPFGGKWKHLERDRQQAVANRLSGKTTMTLPFPETLAPLPSTLSVQVHRNWRATWIAGAFYTLLLGIVLWMFVSTWLINIQYLFAVIAKEQDMGIYELASSTSIIRWSSKPTLGYGDTYPVGVIGVAPLGLIRAEHSTEEYSHQIQQLTAMVASGTGLPLYDLCSLPHL